MKDLAPSLLSAIFIFVVSFNLDYLIHNDIALIVIGVILGAVLYMGIAYVFKFKELQYIKTIYKIR